MSSITEIQQAILVLHETDFDELRKWSRDLDWEQRDRQFEADADSAKLDFLIDEARDAKANDLLEEL